MDANGNPPAFKEFAHLSTAHLFKNCLPRGSCEDLFKNNKFVKSIYGYIIDNPQDEYNMTMVRSICGGPIFKEADLSKVKTLPSFSCRWRPTDLQMTDYHEWIKGFNTYHYKTKASVKYGLVGT